MKKMFLRLVIGASLCFFAMSANAETMQVMSLGEFSTENPSEYIELQLCDDFVYGPEIDLRAGYQIKAKVVDVVSPKRLKRNAKFSIILVSYKDFGGNVHNFPEEYVGKFSPKFQLDKGEIAKDAALAVGNYFVKGISIGYNAVEGAVKNEEGNRFKSGVTAAYESSPLSYANNGEEIEIKKYDFFSFKFKKYRESDTLEDKFEND